MEQMTFLDFFAGIGGFRKGFELCGMRCVGHCEIDKYADRSYRAIHDVKEDEWYAADITKVTPADLPILPLWFQDGSYTVNTHVMDIWTPAGMLAMNLTDDVTISGSLYDDWHIAPGNP